MRLLLIDNYDSFTYNLSDYFQQLGTEIAVYRNDAVSMDFIRSLAVDGIVFSPGPGRPEDAGIMPAVVRALYDQVPMLGICLGHQCIGAFFGGRVALASAPMHGKTSTIYCEEHPLFAGLPASFEVMRYHSLIVEDLEQTPLLSLARTADGENMAFVHPQYPIAGFQFHPESILTEHGLALLDNWLKWIANEHGSDVG